MRKFGIALFTGLALVVLGAAADITGKWEVDVDFDDSSTPGGGIDCTFKQNGEQLTGNCAEAALTGEVKGQDVSWRIQGKGNSPEAKAFTGTVNGAGTRMTGTFMITDKHGHFTASRQR
jgi:hypothetical protein